MANEHYLVEHIAEAADYSPINRYDGRSLWDNDVDEDLHFAKRKDEWRERHVVRDDPCEIDLCEFPVWAYLRVLWNGGVVVWRCGSGDYSRKNSTGRRVANSKSWPIGYFGRIQQIGTFLLAPLG